MVVSVIFNPSRDRWTAAQSLLAATGNAALAEAPQREFGYTLRFGDQDQYQWFVREAQARGFPATSYVTREAPDPEPNELDSPLVWLKATGKPRGLGGPSYGTMYDVSKGCPQCGTGSPQVSPLFVRPGDAPARSNVWQTLDGELLLAPDLTSVLDGATGVRLRQAISNVDSSPLPWFQVIPPHELPPMAPTTVGVYQSDRSRTAPCPRCRRDGFFTRAAYTIRYELDLASVPDVSHTYEYFGRSVLREPFAQSHLAQPLPIVRGSVYERLIRAGAKEIAARPVEVTDRANQFSNTAS
jgi:hypothetical protein